MKKLLCVALALMLVLSLTACSIPGLDSLFGSKDVGKYYFESVETNGMTLGREMFSSMGVDEEELDKYLFLEITAPGKATMTVDGETKEMEYDSTSMWPVDDPEEKANCTIDDGKVTIEADDAKMIFVKK